MWQNWEAGMQIICYVNNILALSELLGKNCFILSFIHLDYMAEELLCVKQCYSSLDKGEIMENTAGITSWVLSSVSWRKFLFPWNLHLSKGNWHQATMEMKKQLMKWQVKTGLRRKNESKRQTEWGVGGIILD